MAGEPALIVKDITMDDLVTGFPAVVRVFLRRSMHCVGCDFGRFHSVADVAAAYGIALDPFLIELNEAASSARVE